MWHLKKQGYAESTVKTWTWFLKRLVKEGANLMDPESIKLTIARHDNWSDYYKAGMVQAYDRFTELQGIRWTPPSYQPAKELPFIPLETEIDQLIAGCGKKVAASLQLLKETGMRIGEAWQLKWIDVDEERRTVKCRPEKHGNPRMFKVSAKLMAMLKALPKTSELVFGGTNLNGHRDNFIRQRRRIARKLQNPRLEKISFHTLRHWKGTMEYHRTKDILHVKQLLGHRSINSTMIYTHLVDWERDDEFTVKVAEKPEEIKQLLKAGFEYMCEKDGLMFFRKRK
jgi:integrase